VVKPPLGDITKPRWFSVQPRFTKRPSVARVHPLHVDPAGDPSDHLKGVVSPLRVATGDMVFSANATPFATNALVSGSTIAVTNVAPPTGADGTAAETWRFASSSQSATM
jgi:hypothetical protein